ncbi:C-type lectin domain family 4 member G-like [Hippoglossus hippoglossus]|uniref:C-type lectin domain family 4 member G-like n=1 Tax=Hippoglossus hippoglossus TaxID=8267 RepID=UPI00148C96D7|nr:C-type lectin domain family 4 member G-like [Hippoglossus hippoglossus]
MEEELHYATVVFKNGGSPQKENDEDSTIYSTIKSKVPAATVTIKAAGGAAGGAAAGGAAAGGAAAGGTAAGGTAAGGTAAAHSRHFVLLLVCLGILCVLLMACIGVIIYICGVMKAQEAVAENVIHLEKENHQLMMEKQILENETEVLTRDRDDLNRTLGVIMTFQNFPVNKFCPDKKCQPCRESWIPFQDHCYQFYEQSAPWKTWDQARTFCQNTDADLVVVDSLQEQEFINNHTKYYYDKHHGYWMGLRQNDDENWIWIDGRNETEGFWNQTKVDNDGRYAMTFPGHNATASWGPAECIMQNKFICEHEALIRTPGS